jgi:hypothetical protein
MSFDQMFTRIGFNYYYWSLLCIHLLSWTFLVLACLIVPRTWQEKARSVQGEKRQSFWRSLVHGPALTRLSLRQRMLSINPFYWLAGRERFPIFAVWGFLFCCAAFWTWGLLKYPHYWLDEIPYVWTALIVHTVLKIWIASEAGRRLTIDRRSGALELLLSTPMSVREILKGQILALRRQFLGPLLVVLCADVVFAIASHRDQDLNWIWTAGITMLIADVIVLPFVGMWAGLSARNTNRAAGTAIARIMVLPWIIWALFWTGIAFMSFGGRMSLGPELPVVSWMAIGFGVDLFFGLRAWHLLHGRFRAVVAGRFDARGRSLSFATTPAPAAPAADSVGGG